MGNQINIDGVLTQIQEVDFDGDTDITSVQFNGTEIWVKAPTALEVVEGFDASLDVAAGSWSRGTVHGMSQATARSDATNNPQFIGAPWGPHGGDHVQTIGSFAISEDSPLNLSPNNTVVYGQHGGNSPGSIDTLKINGDAVTLTDSQGGYSLAIAIAHTEISIEDIDDVTATFRGSTGRHPSHAWAFILAGKWDVTSISTSASGSTTMEPGDILIYGGFGYGDGNIGYPSAWANPVEGTLVYQKVSWWYWHAVNAVWVNKNSTDLSAAWTDYLGSYPTRQMVRLRHIGV